MRLMTRISSRGRLAVGGRWPRALALGRALVTSPHAQAATSEGLLCDTDRAPAPSR